MLTAQDRTALRERCALLNLSGLEALAEHCLRENRPDAAKLVWDIIAERRLQERAKAVPLEVVGARPAQPAAPRVQPAVPGPRPAPYWTADRVRYGLLFIGGSSAVVGLLAFVVFPAIVAAVALLSAILPYLIGGAFALVVLFSVISSAVSAEKKSGSSVESPRSGGGNVYNVYIGEGQVHVHPGGEK